MAGKLRGWQAKTFVYDNNSTPQYIHSNPLYERDYLDDYYPVSEASLLYNSNSGGEKTKYTLYGIATVPHLKSTAEIQTGGIPV